MKIVECIINFSEGRNTEIIKKISDAISSVTGVQVLNQHVDKDHNRSVISFIGEPKIVVEAAFQGTKMAAKIIDLTKHTGEHPRIGATDVIPFVPISNVTMEECVELAIQLGKKVATELQIPVYLYEHAATRPMFENLANIRNIQFENLKEEIKHNPDRKPDFGPNIVHSTAGATVIGARDPLIAYNVLLGTNDVEIAKKIAHSIRHSSGGLPHVKALGFNITERNLVQVSMNLVNYTKTPIYQVFEMIKKEAERWSVSIIESEVVGLIPIEALLTVSKYYLKLHDFSNKQFLEYYLGELGNFI